MKTFTTSSFRLTFAAALQAKLQPPSSIQLCPLNPHFSRALANPVTLINVKGALPLCQHGELGETQVGITLMIWPDWMSFPPMASTDAAFLRDHRDWHVPRKPYICYELAREWRWKLDELWNSGADPSTIVEAGSSWCIRNIDSLITRHLHAHRYGILKWPVEWAQWRHGEFGVREFEAQIRTLEAA